MRVTIGILALSLAGSAQGFAEGQADTASVCALSEKHYSAIRAGDMDAILQQHSNDFTFFASDGGLLWTFHSTDQQRAEFEATTPDFASKTYIRHCSAQVYGNTGIATFYLVGSVTAGGNTVSGTWRVTEIWAKHGSEWKEVHHHESPLLASVRP
jgi:ketosteroid isomerase-like protein